jgi:hypothetical protein
MYRVSRNVLGRKDVLVEAKGRMAQRRRVIVIRDVFWGSTSTGDEEDREPKVWTRQSSWEGVRYVAGLGKRE